MTWQKNGISGAALRLAAIAGLAASLGACSMVPNWMGGDADDAPAVDASSSSTPDLANVPDRPTPPASDDQNAQVAQSLEADHTHAQYSADALRGGTEAAAPPPAAGPPPDTKAAQNNEVAAPADDTGDDTQVASASSNPNSGPYTRPTFDSEVAPKKRTVDNVPDLPGKAAMPGTLPTSGAPESSAPLNGASAAPAADAATAQVASADMPAAQSSAPAAGASAAPSADSMPAQSAAAPTVQPPAAPVQGAQAAMMADGALGFRRSTAPPLDPGVSNFVPGSVVARYRQTANLTPPSSAYSGAGGYGAAIATVMFGGDSTALDDAARQQVQAAAELFKSHGNAGYVRVVGHSPGSGSTANGLSADLARSQARADAVAKALIKAGVPASRVLVDASAPGGQASAQIFLQS